MTGERYEEDDYSGDEYVSVVRGRSGTAAFLPRSAARLDEEQLLAVRELQSIGHQLGILEGQGHEVAREARALGVSWSLIGFCLGFTGEAARLRYGGDRRA